MEAEEWVGKTYAPRAAMIRHLVDIIIPVYGDFEATRICIESVIKHLDASQHLVLINDKSPDKDIAEYLIKIKKDNPGVSLIEHKDNLGFVKTANEGMLLSKANDIILLNSDTVVTKGWVGKLRKRAYERENIATVTPFSNSATIFSYPNPGGYNDILKGYDPDTMNEIFERIGSDMPHMNVPTGHGFCMYITRDAIKTVGVFDEQAFGRGYGEENDFCQRAALLGFTNAVCFECFIYHKEGASFGKGRETEDRKQKAIEIINTRYPRYLTEISNLVDQDIFLGFRAQIDLEIVRKDKRPRLLMVEHNWGGGVEIHVGEFSKAAETNGWIALRVRPLLDGVLLKSSQFSNIELAFIGQNWFERLVNTLEFIGIDHIHYHQTVGQPGEIKTLPKVLGTKYDVTLHDYFFACPRTNFYKQDNEYCDATTDMSVCNKCLRGKTGIERWRAESQDFLAGAREVFAPSAACANIILKYFPKIPIKVIPHPYRDFIGKVDLEHKIGKRVNVAVVGMIGTHKGLKILSETIQYSRDHKLPINWFLFGEASNEYQLAGLAKRGRYNSRQELGKHYSNDSIDITLFTSIWPETFSYVISESWDFGVPVISSSVGAQGERVGSVGAGWVLDNFNPENICKKIIEIKSSPTAYLEAISKIKKYNPLSEIDWLAYYGNLSLKPNRLLTSEKVSDITKIVVTAAHDSTLQRLLGKLSFYEEENRTISQMYHNSEEQRSLIVHSRVWKTRNRIAKVLRKGEI